jgi:hypothetical protein
LSKTRLLHREKNAGCSHQKAVALVIGATSPEVAPLTLGVHSADLRLLPLDRKMSPEITDAPTASPTFVPGGAVA